jgi:hypothetical protein
MLLGESMEVEGRPLRESRPVVFSLEETRLNGQALKAGVAWSRHHFCRCLFRSLPLKLVPSHCLSVSPEERYARRHKPV